MIFVSSACVKNKTIKESVLELYQAGFQNIELSGGTVYYDGMEADLLVLKEKYNLNLICHNYFPPPPLPFVLNLASLNERVNQDSLDHVLKSLDLSKKLEAPIYAVHAGYLIDIPVDEVGKKLNRYPLFEEKLALKQFIENIEIISEAAGDIDLYIENNVISAANYERYFPAQPLFFCDYEGFCSFARKLNIKPLLDVAHLKVSCNVLKKDFNYQLTTINELTDYIHISDNDGLYDTNQHLEEGSELYMALNNINLAGKVITLEVYNGLDKVRETYENVQKLIK